MAQNSIIKKLDHELRQEITTERQVVYILAEVRKLLEVTEETDNFKALSFYCSWALHTRMKREGAGRILERFDKAHALAIVMPGTPNIENLPEALRDEIGNTMICTKFRWELEAVLQKHGLPTNVTFNAYEWIRFC
jgi:hypothetical protein